MSHTFIRGILFSESSYTEIFSDFYRYFENKNVQEKFGFGVNEIDNIVNDRKNDPYFNDMDEETFSHDILAGGGELYRFFKDRGYEIYGITRLRDTDDCAIILGQQIELSYGKIVTKLELSSPNPLPEFGKYKVHWYAIEHV